MDEWRQQRGEAPQEGGPDEGGGAGASRIGDDTAGATRADGGGVSGGGGTAGGGGGGTGGMTGTGDDIGAGDSIGSSAQPSDPVSAAGAGMNRVGAARTETEEGTGAGTQPDADITES